MVVGTPEYMAPEQARGQPVGPMTDLYALGVVAFEMVTGRLPFTGTSPVDLLLKHVDARPPRPSDFLPGLPAALDAFILQMLTKDPEARPGSAEQLRRQFQRLRESILLAPPPVAPLTAPAASPLAHLFSPEMEPAQATASEPSAPKPSAPAPKRAATPPEVLAAEAPSEPLIEAPPPPLPAPRTRRLLPLGLGALGVVAAAGLVFALRAPPPAPVEPSPTVQPPVRPTEIPRAPVETAHAPPPTRPARTPDDPAPDPIPRTPPR